MAELDDMMLESVCGGKQRRQGVDFGPTLRRINNAADAHADAARNLSEKLRNFNP